VLRVVCSTVTPCAHCKRILPASHVSLQFGERAVQFYPRSLPRVRASLHRLLAGHGLASILARTWEAGGPAIDRV
jgi:hypothetical protein